MTTSKFNPNGRIIWEGLSPIDNAPIVLLTGAQNVNASGVVLVEADTLASATTAVTITASVTCV